MASSMELDQLLLPVNTTVAALALAASRRHRACARCTQRRWPARTPTKPGEPSGDRSPAPAQAAPVLRTLHELAGRLGPLTHIRLT
ncbi:hypothetical protein GUJ93_ZPchr0004g38358 [Zizania palustris]|uniref:Uncharacterized protein n=1 Tax=Zizania palustris TaxID=103762 RepID=A0A8J5SDP3_ZIZPA|nr:hypothetical protein GUJ93_ZPchr0004g38358 [Zizania palustris]